MIAEKYILAQFFGQHWSKYLYKMWVTQFFLFPETFPLTFRNSENYRVSGKVAFFLLKQRLKYIFELNFQA